MLISILCSVNVPGLPFELQNSQFGSVPITDTSSLGQFASSGFQYFGPAAGAQQPSYYPYFDAPALTEEEQKAFAANFAANFGANAPAQSGQVTGSSADPSVQFTLQGAPLSNPSAEIAALLESENSAKSQDKATSDEKQNTTPSSPLPSSLPEDPKTSQPKLNSVKIIQNDPFNGQFPLL